MIPAWIGLALRGTAALIVVAGAVWALSSAYRYGYAKAQSECRAAEAAAAEYERELARERTKINERIDRDAYQSFRRLEARAAAADADARGLRDALSALIAAGTPQSAGCADVERQRDGLAQLLAEAGELVGQCVEKGERLAITVTGLQQYVREIGQMPGK